MSLDRTKLFVTGVALALAGCGGSAIVSPPSSGAAPSAAVSSVSATSTPATANAGASASVAPPASPSLAGTFDVGDGRELYLECMGSGSPTLLLEAGDAEVGDPAPGGRLWTQVVPSLSGHTRVCIYDRAGVGRSSPATGCRQLDDLLDDLDKLLVAADIDGPYVLVGASGGGFIMAGFAARHPDRVAGMVFVETPKALTAELYPEVLPQIACDAPDNIEHRDYLAVEHAAWDKRAKIGDFPMVVISNDYGTSVPPDTDEATNVEDQRGWFDLSPNNARQVMVTGGHHVEPAVVVREILAVLEAARAG